MGPGSYKYKVKTIRQGAHAFLKIHKIKKIKINKNLFKTILRPFFFFGGGGGGKFKTY